MIYCSLAKFAQAGRDKYTGGVIQVYNAGTPYFNAFNRALDQLQREPSCQLSTPANRFFSVMLNPHYGRPSFLGQLEGVRGSTNYLAQLLRSARGTDGVEAQPISGSHNPCIELVSRHGNQDGDIPMLALKVNRLIYNTWTHKKDIKENTYTMIYHYLLALSQARDLPMSPRGSFGFDHATLSEAVSPHTMRLTVWLEDSKDIVQYATIFRTANTAIAAYFDNKDTFKAYIRGSTNVHDNLAPGKTRTDIMKRAAQYRQGPLGRDMPFPDFVQLCIQ